MQLINNVQTMKLLITKPVGHSEIHVEFDENEILLTDTEAEMLFAGLHSVLGKRGDGEKEAMRQHIADLRQVLALKKPEKQSKA
jgi:hypothetical protein